MYISERLPRETGKEYALRVIKDNIIRLDLEPGSSVSVNDLAAELGLSRTPVREALAELAKIGIVEVFPQSGSRIALIDFDLVEESRFMRNTLECAVAREMCEHCSEEHLFKLEENVKLQEMYLEKQLAGHILELDNEFHRMLFEMSNRIQIYDIMRSFSIHFDRLRSMTVATVKDLKIVNDHKAIMEAFEKKDGDAAAAAMNHHLSRYKIDVEEIRKKYTDYFK